MSVAEVAARGFQGKDQSPGYTVASHLLPEAASLFTIHLTQLRDGFVVGSAAHHQLLDGEARPVSVTRSRLVPWTCKRAHAFKCASMRAHG